MSLDESVPYATTFRPPTATYRFQLHEGFGFHDAARLAGYLARLGVSDLYVSPIFKAAPGSTHGYDVLDHDSLSPELGGAEGFQALCDAAKEHDLGLIVDFVPNHMGVGCDGNRIWEDVLEHGRASERADFFDIEWHPPKPTLADKVLLPILPDQYGLCLERGYFSLHFDGSAIRLRAGSRTLPLRPRSLGRVLSRVSDLLETRADFAQADELRALGRELSELNDSAAVDTVESYRRSASALQHRLRELVSFAGLERRLEQALSELGGDSLPESFDFLDELLRAQHYRLSAWQLALEAVNYRRFFDVTELAALRIEEPSVFDACHRTLLSLIEQRKITGVRFDHVDGLLDPISYLRRFAERLTQALPDSDPSELPIYVLVEKILAPGESLPATFRAHGTTGYEFARIASGVFIDRRAELNLSSTYRHFTGDNSSFEDHLLQAKRDVLSSLLASDATMLSRALERLAEQDRRWRDLSWQSLHAALIEVMAALGAYRSYVRPEGGSAPEDEALINSAVAAAIRRNPTWGRGAFQFLRSLLLMETKLEGASEFAMRFQQTTGPVTAKALEDTAFYRYCRNLAENEVGGRPDRMGVELREFHAQLALQQSEHHFAQNSTSTHDTKRGEDARSRLSMLSELPNTWRQTVHELHRLASKHCAALEGDEAPSRVDRYLYYQALVGVMPFGAKQGSATELVPRMQEYMQKAVREAKQRSSWLHPNEGYEAAVQGFVASTLADPAFVAKILRFCERISSHAASKALSQLTLKLCAPGVPDTYQGSEVWHQVLVDPDNRRPVDYARLVAELGWLDERRAERESLLSNLLSHYTDGRLKLFVLSELLRLRRASPELFRSGYQALDAGSNCVAFGRGPDECDLVCAVTRFPVRVTRGRMPFAIGKAWGEQRVSGAGLRGAYRNALTGQAVEAQGSLALSTLFRDLPIAVLIR